MKKIGPYKSIFGGWDAFIRGNSRSLTNVRRRRATAFPSFLGTGGMTCFGGVEEGLLLDDVGDDDALGRIVPVAVGVDAGGVGASGGHDGGGSGSDVAGLFKNVLEGEAEVAAADVVEADGVSVTIDGDPGDAEAAGCGFIAGVFSVIGGVVEEVGDGVGAVPVDEEVFDGFAFGMAADGAFAAMAGEVGSMVDESRGRVEAGLSMVDFILQFWGMRRHGCCLLLSLRWMMRMAGPRWRARLKVD